MAASDSSSFVAQLALDAMRTFEGVLGAILMVGAGIIAIFSLQIWLPVRALRVKWWWSAIAFLVPGGNLVFSYFYWPIAKKPVLIGLMTLCFTLLVFFVRNLISILLHS